MKRKGEKLVVILFIVTSIIFICIGSYAHSGRTDSSGGHRDNNNKSGLGYYHYHCGGHPAHLHKNGKCPYSKSSSKSKKSVSTIKKSSKSTKKKNVNSKAKKSSTNKTNTTSKVKTKSNSKKISTTPIATEKVNENSTNIINHTTEDSNTGEALVTLGLIGGGSYLGYKKYKKSKQ